MVNTQKAQENKAKPDQEAAPEGPGLSFAEMREGFREAAQRRAATLAEAAQRRERISALASRLDVGDRVRVTFAHSPHDPKPRAYEGRLHGSDLSDDVLRLVEHPGAPEVVVAGEPGDGLVQLERITPGRRVSVAYSVGLQVEVDLDAGEIFRVRVTEDITPDRDGYSEDIDTFRPLSSIDPARDAAYAVAETAIWPGWS